MKKFISGFFTLLAMNVAVAQSTNPMDIHSMTLQREDGPFLIEEVKINQKDALAIAQAEGYMSPAFGKVSSAANIGEVIMVADKIIALGEKIYKIIEKGRPVVQTQYAPISILPKDSKGQSVDVMDMENWSSPKSVKYKASYRNGYGMNVVTIEFIVLMAYGGSYNGKGRYLTSAQIIPSHVDVAWGFDVAATMKLNSIQNKGTKENPIAAAILNFEYRVKTVVKHDENHMSFYMDGNGTLTAL
jgi:hypothetical protein